jgi:hypothetical protein
MCPSYARIRLPQRESLSRFSQWIGLPELEPPRKVKSSKSVDDACKDGVWRSVVAVFVYESEGWTVFEDLTGHFATFSADRWLAFADRDELVVAGYNDTVPYGQYGFLHESSVLIVVQGGSVVREFLDDHQDPRQNVNRGRLPSEKTSPIEDWISAASFVDADDIVHLPDEGLLWMFGPAA